MKKIFLSILFVSGLFVTSCKDKENNESENKKEVVLEKPNSFNVTFEIKIKKDDDLILYYKDGTNEWIVEDKAIWQTIKGSESFQKVTFSFPEGVVPNDFRFDIGRNEYKGQEPIEINSLKLEYFDKVFEVTKNDFINFFTPNKYIIFNKENNTYSFEKNSDGTYDPYFETKPALYPILADLVLK